MWSPMELSAWYRSWPTWARWAGVLVFGVIFVVGWCFWMLRRRDDLPADEVITAINDEISESIETNLDKIDEINEERKAARDVDARVQETMERDNAKRKALRRDLASARHASEVDALYERLRVAAKRRNDKTDN